MKVVVASLNPVKLGAARSAFETHFPDTGLEFVTAAVDSGVADQPMTDDETRLGARNRAINAWASFPGVDFSVGMEGGLQYLEDALLGFAWMAVKGPGDVISEARTPTLPLPPEVAHWVAQGLELGKANDRVFATINSKQGGGAFGLLTDGRQTREGVYAQALELALIPFTHSLWGPR